LKLTHFGVSEKQKATRNDKKLQWSPRRKLRDANERAVVAAPEVAAQFRPQPALLNNSQSVGFRTALRSRISAPQVAA
jgi:hypothetical protein